VQAGVYKPLPSHLTSANALSPKHSIREGEEVFCKCYMPPALQPARVIKRESGDVYSAACFPLTSGVTA